MIASLSLLRKYSLLSLLLLSISCAQIQTKRGSDGTANSTDAEGGEEVAVISMDSDTEEVGVILGPGGLKSIAHIGVLKSLDKANISVKAIIGLEWGASVAAIYSRKAKVHDLEWQMSKITDENLPNPGFFKNNIDLENPNRINGFLEKVFQDYNLASSKLPFSCPTKSFRSQSTSWLQSGSAYRELKKCLAYPPLFYSYNGWHGDALAIEGAIKRLRSQGVKKIVFVDVLANDSFSSSKKILDQEAEKILWQEVKEEIDLNKSKVDYYIGVDTSKFSMLDYKQARDLIKVGETAAEAVAKSIANK